MFGAFEYIVGYINSISAALQLTTGHGSALSGHGIADVVTSLMKKAAQRKQSQQTKAFPKPVCQPFTLQAIYYTMMSGNTQSTFHKVSVITKSISGFTCNSFLV